MTCQFYLPDDLSEKLEALVVEPGSAKTAILTDSLKTWLDRSAGNELDERFGFALTGSATRMSLASLDPAVSRIRRDGRAPVGRPDQSSIAIAMVKAEEGANE